MCLRGSFEGRTTEECSTGLGVSATTIEVSELGSVDSLAIIGGEMRIEDSGENRPS